MRPVQMQIGARRPGRTGILALGLAALAACDFEVTNPGPVLDEYMEQSSAHKAMVTGASRGLSDATNWLGYTGGVAVLELQGSGNITRFGVTLLQRQGKLSPAEQETDDHWGRGHRARWVAEETVRRMKTALGADFSKSALAAEALLYAGYINRLLGENLCFAVIDGGPQQPRSVHTDRALAAFNEAYDVAKAVGAGGAKFATAALAGRASVKVWKGDWDGAAADAAQVPKDFVFAAKYSDIEEDQHNRIYYAGANKPFRAATVWSTFYEKYYETTKDPRATWAKDPKYPTGDGSSILFYRQMKFTATTAPINLSSGREMRLIMAEARLRKNDVPGALALMNELRADLKLPALAAGNAAEAWTHLRRERAVELWLEGRQLGDVYRWEKEGVPGTPVQTVAGRDRCFPIGQTELNTNPNLK